MNVELLTDTISELATTSAQKISNNAHRVAIMAKGLALAERAGVTTEGPGEAVHVLPAQSGWVARDEDATSPIASFDRKRDAVSAARELAREREGVLIIHDMSGDPISVYSYTPDEVS